MITYTCVHKYMDKNCRVTGYRLRGYNGDEIDVASSKLKDEIKCGSVYVDNLVLTSNNKLMRRKMAMPRYNEFITELTKMMQTELKVIDNNSVNITNLKMNNETGDIELLTAEMGDFKFKGRPCCVYIEFEYTEGNKKTGSFSINIMDNSGDCIPLFSTSCRIRGKSCEYNLQNMEIATKKFIGYLNIMTRT